MQKKVMSSSPELSASSGMHHFRQREQQQPSPPPSTPPPSIPPPPSFLSKDHLSLLPSKQNLIMLVESPEITKEEIHTTQLNSVPMRQSPLSAEGTGDQNVFRNLKLPIEERLAAALSCFGDEVEKVEIMDRVPWVESPELFREQEALDKLMPLSSTQLQDEIAQALKFNGNIHSNEKKEKEEVENAGWEKADSENDDDDDNADNDETDENDVDLPPPGSPPKVVMAPPADPPPPTGVVAINKGTIELAAEPKKKKEKKKKRIMGALEGEEETPLTCASEEVRHF